MGRAVVFDLTRQGVPVRLLETDVARARAVARRYGHGRARSSPSGRARAWPPSSKAWTSSSIAGRTA